MKGWEKAVEAEGSGGVHEERCHATWRDARLKQ